MRLGREPAPDVVVSNAADVAEIRDVTSEGIQRTLATTHLAPYLLLRSLIEPIGGRPARFVVVGASPEALARVPVDLDDLGCVTGKFFFKRKLVETAPHTRAVARCDRLWDESARLVGLSPAL